MHVIPTELQVQGTVSGSDAVSAQHFVTKQQLDAATSVTVVTGSIATAAGQGEIVIADAAATDSSIVICQLVPNADFDADDLEDYNVSATPSAGQLVFTITNSGPVVGDFKIAYKLG